MARPEPRVLCALPSCRLAPVDSGSHGVAEQMTLKLSSMISSKHGRVTSVRVFPVPVNRFLPSGMARPIRSSVWLAAAYFMTHLAVTAISPLAVHSPPLLPEVVMGLWLTHFIRETVNGPLSSSMISASPCIWIRHEEPSASPWRTLYSPKTLQAEPSSLSW